MFSAIPIILGVILKIIEKEHEQELATKNNNEFFVVRSPKIYRWIGLIDIYFFLMLFCSRLLYNHINNNINWWDYPLCGVFILLGCAIVIQTISWKIDVFRERDCFYYRTFFFRKYTVFYKDCIYYKINQRTSTLVLKTKNKKFYIDTHAINYDYFLDMLMRHKVKNNT